MDTSGGVSASFSSAELVAKLLTDAKTIVQLVAQSKVPRLSALTWHGIPVPCLAELTRLKEIVAHGVDISSGHGIARLLYQSPVTRDETGSFPTVWNLPGLSTRPWFDESHAKTLLEAAWPAIAEEFHAWSGSLSPHPDSTEVVNEGSWTSFFLMDASGRVNAHAERRFRAVCSVMAAMEPCRNFGFVAFFKTIAGTLFARHRGSANLRLRHQLCIGLGDDTVAYLEVGGEARTWALGKCLAFDDSYPHEVKHISGEARIVLAFDAWHPNLTSAEKAVLRHPAFAQFGKMSLSRA